MARPRVSRHFGMMPRLGSSRKLIATAPLLPLLVACSIGRPSERSISQIIETSSKFRTPHVVYVPKQLVLIPRVVGTADGASVSGMMNAAYRSPSLDPAAIAHIDGTVALMRAAGFVSVFDASNAVTISQAALQNALIEENGQMSIYAGDRPRTFDLYGHVITVQRRDLPADVAKFWRDDEDGPPDDDYYHGFTGIRATPGWRVEVARRALVRIDEILDETSINDPVAKGELLVKFTYRWEPTESGEVFVPGTDANKALPDYFRYLSSLGGGAMREREVHAHLVLKKTDKGWKIARMAAGWMDFGGPDASL